MDHDCRLGLGAGRPGPDVQRHVAREQLGLGRPAVVGDVVAHAQILTRRVRTRARQTPSITGICPDATAATRARVVTLVLVRVGLGELHDGLVEGVLVPR